jgi:hypothetical protein
MTDLITPPSDEILYVVTSIFNPENVEVRYKLYRDFKAYINSFPNVILVTAELAIGDQPFVVTSNTDPNNIQLRTNDVLWYKENLDNILFKWLIKKHKTGKVAWIDADVAFSNVNWVNDTLKLLNTYDFVQLFSHCHSLGPKGEILASDPSFVYNWILGLATPKRRGRSGGAWAATFDALQRSNFLIDWDIVGASDWFHTFALTNQTPPTATPCRAKNELHSANIRKTINGNVYYVEGTLIHFFHGYPSDRGYGTRGAILIRNNFDPDVDIGYREDGLIYFTSDKPALKQEIIEYFASRKEHAAGEVPQV